MAQFICSLCLEDLLEDDKKFIFSTCSHRFHEFCTIKYFCCKYRLLEENVRCPSCNVDSYSFEEMEGIIEKYEDIPRTKEMVKKFCYFKPGVRKCRRPFFARPWNITMLKLEDGSYLVVRSSDYINK